MNTGPVPTGAAVTGATAPRAPAAHRATSVVIGSQTGFARCCTAAPDSCGQFAVLQPTTGASRSASAARPTGVTPSGANHAGRHPLALLLVQHRGVATVDPLALRAAAGDLQPQHVINLPFWSTLMLEFDAP